MHKFRPTLALSPLMRMARITASPEGGGGRAAITQPD